MHVPRGMYQLWGMWMCVCLWARTHSSHPPHNTHSLSRSRGTTRQWRPCHPCRSHRSWRRVGCRPRTCPGWWQPAQPGPGTSRYWCPAWKTSSLWSPYSWPPGSCPALQTQWQTNKVIYIGWQLHKCIIKPCQCVLRYTSCLSTWFNGFEKRNLQK